VAECEALHLILSTTGRKKEREREGGRGRERREGERKRGRKKGENFLESSLTSK
jgi:hypothetical protein